MIDYPKGSYCLTEEKAKKLINTMKHQLRVIIDRYSQSGNGSDMRVVEDVDSDIEEIKEAAQCNSADYRSKVIIKEMLLVLIQNFL